MQINWSKFNRYALVIYPVFSQSPPKYRIAGLRQEKQIRNHGFQSFCYLNVIYYTERFHFMTKQFEWLRWPHPTSE